MMRVSRSVSQWFAHIAIDAVDYVPRGQGRDLWVGLDDVVGKHFDKRLPFLLRLPEHRLYVKASG